MSRGSKLPGEAFARSDEHTGTLDVTDDGTALVVHELDADLGDTTTGA